ncbi:hypothetical protein M0G43_12110 [Subsaxibacter sp. CAU 1640]|uniref:hypothetical protein n=1 Tax=Subsaxibacter sp. CAU 1640 TaxID=2933271 RepID=UPI0020033B75|nr:hypothetical protein [Subsaxibacter sp. CAU 1640]MCK7591322.1 hypothetical protein [Subsaxibacter sp. CAU 1640]
MKYPYLKIDFKENIDEGTIAIISRYWELKDGVFINSPTALRSEIKITQPKLNSVVKDNSQTVLYIEDCVECGNPIGIEVTTQSTAKKKLENTRFQCLDCQTKFNQENKEIPAENKKIHRLEYAIKYRMWNKLTREELAVLNKIIEVDNYKNLNKELIQSNPNYYWLIIEKLNRLSLIDVQREDNYVKTIYFLPELAVAMQINPRKNISVESSLNFHLPKRFNNTKKTQPDFSKIIEFDSDIIIKAGTRYFCSVWINSDGSINFGMKPTSELDVNNNGNKDYEPKHIAEIIRKMRD